MPFTRIELMIAVAIVGVLGSVAMTAYSDYIRESKVAKVTAHFHVAIDSIKYQYGSAHVQRSKGRTPDPPVPATSVAWATLLDRDTARAPDGGPAYVPGAGVTGSIGLTAAGSWATDDSQVTITRPAFANLSVTTVVVTQEL